MSQLDDKQHFMLKLGRVQLLQELSLLDPSETTIYDQFTELASQVLGTPISMVSMVAAQHQFFQGAVGLPPAVEVERKVPLSHSFCKHVVADNAPLIAPDLRQINLLKDNPAIADFSVIGYLGIPLKLFDERTLGSFCVIDLEPHEWSQTDVVIMAQFAEMISQEFDLRARTHIDIIYRKDLDAMHSTLAQFFVAAAEHISESMTEAAKITFSQWVQTWRLENQL